MEVLQLSDNIEFTYMGRRPKIDKIKTGSWLNQIAKSYQKSIHSLNYTFCNDEELLEININYLQHNFYTDIITFDLSDNELNIEGDIYISIDRIKDNAKLHNCKMQDELNRVMAHGLLHLIGFKDKTKKEASAMREAEDKALELWNEFQVPRETESEMKHN